MTAAVRCALLAFARDYLAASGAARGGPYAPAAVLDRMEVCRSYRVRLPRTIEYARLRAYIAHIGGHEEMALYEEDVRAEANRRWAAQRGVE